MSARTSLNALKAPNALNALPALLALALLAACSSRPPPPGWQMDARSALERASAAWLEGRTAVEAAEFARARAELARTGRPALVARAELLRCATRVASLVFEGCPGFDALAQDADPADQAYARYLAGAAQPADAALLPEPQRAAAAAAGGAPVAALVASVADPLSALVAAGVAVRRGDASAATAEAAVERASAQGWRRPLLAWLRWQQQAAQAAGDTATAERLQRRIDLAGS